MIDENVTYRASLLVCAVPLGLRSVGRARFAPGQRTEPRETTFTQVFWTVNGNGVVEIDGRGVVVKRDWAFVCPPRRGRRLLTTREPWEYWWCTLDGPLATLALGAFQVPKTPFRAGSCPLDLFAELADALGDPSPDGERRASVEAYRFLALLADRAASKGKAEATGRVTGLLSDSDFDPFDPSVNAQSIAERAGKSRFSTRRWFKEELGVSPKPYLDALRLQRAYALLRESDLPIKDVAAAAGFANANYFAKFFRRKTGFSPSKFHGERHLP